MTLARLDHAERRRRDTTVPDRIGEHGHAGTTGNRRPLDAAETARYEALLGEMLGRLGLDVDTASTVDTPRRMLAALVEATDGYDGDPKLITAFPTECHGGSSCEIAQIVDGTSTTALAFERCWGKGQGTWVGAVPLAVIQPGPLNTAITPPIADVSAPTLVEAHSHYVNCDFDEDSGMDDVSSLHPGGAFILFADGSVRFEKSAAPTGWSNGVDLNPALRRMAAIGTRAGKEVITPD